MRPGAPGIDAASVHLCTLQDQASKLREERDAGARDVTTLRLDLDSTRQERDRLLADATRLQQEVERIRWAAGGWQGGQGPVGCVQGLAMCLWGRWVEAVGL